MLTFGDPGDSHNQATVARHRSLDCHGWVISIFGGRAVRLRKSALLPAISPDGSRIIFTTGEHMRTGVHALNTLGI